ncbi:MAG: tripartite tricarboxylate transporter substrate binding protein [Burkholderiales bacterium]|nr:tripartite tricarboxylate transporter substrate binding protein [Burkholderiales bacterium]
MAAGLLLTGLTTATAAPAPAGVAGAYPTRPITLIVPFAPGGIADLTARSVAQAMAASLGQPVVVDNRPSAGSIVASQAVARAGPDGYTLLLMSNANAVSASLFRKLPFDVSRDFAPISLLGSFELAACVGAGSRFKSLAELLTFGRANPGKLTIASITVGSTQHLAAELFLQRSGVLAVVVPYKGSPAVITALRSGEADLAFEILGPTLGQISGGALRALAVTGAQRNPALPGVPTMAEAGVADYTVASWNALAAPAGTPPEVITRLNRAAREAITSPTVAQQLRGLGVHAQAGSPAELAELLAGEIKRWRGVITAAKIELQ